MKLKDFKNSDGYDAMFLECIHLDKQTITYIRKRFNLSYQKAKILYEEAKKYNDEVFFHGALYELSFMEEPPTVARIMRDFNVSYLLAKKVFEFYTENC